MKPLNAIIFDPNKVFPVYTSSKQDPNFNLSKTEYFHQFSRKTYLRGPLSKVYMKSFSKGCSIREAFFVPPKFQKKVLIR